MPSFLYNYTLAFFAGFFHIMVESIETLCGRSFLTVFMQKYALHSVAASAVHQSDVWEPSQVRWRVE